MRKRRHPLLLFSVLDQSALLKVVMSVMAFFSSFFKKEQTLESFRFEERSEELCYRVGVLGYKY